MASNWAARPAGPVAFCSEGTTPGAGGTGTPDDHVRCDQPTPDDAVLTSPLARS